MTDPRSADWPNLTIPLLLEARSQDEWDWDWLHDGTHEASAGDVIGRARSLATDLADKGVEPGDHVGLWMVNWIDWVVAFFGISMAGGVVVPINTYFRIDEARSLVRSANVSVLIAGDQSVTSPTGALARQLVREGIAARAEVLRRGDTRRLMSSLRSDRPPPDVSRQQPDDLAAIMYTSGSTGSPKGVMISHRQLLGPASRLSEYLHITDEDRIYNPNPFFHYYGLVGGVLASLWSKSRLWFAETFNASDALNTIEARRCTVFSGYPPMYLKLLGHPDFLDNDLSSLRAAITGLTGVEDRLSFVRMLRQQFGLRDLVTSWGSTETGALVCTNRVGLPDDVIANSVGFPNPGWSLKLLAPETEVEVTEEGLAGEAVVRSPMVTKGYYGDADGTAAAFTSDGWFRTGDLLSRRPDGRYEFRGRLKEMLKVGGENVDCTEVEQVLRSIPSVRDAAVVGQPDSTLGEVPVAFVVLAGESQVTDVEAQVRPRLAAFKRPRLIRSVESLPMTASGKVDKGALNKWVLDDIPPGDE